MTIWVAGEFSAVEVHADGGAVLAFKVGSVTGLVCISKSVPTLGIDVIGVVYVVEVVCVVRVVEIIEIIEIVCVVCVVAVVSTVVVTGDDAGCQQERKQ